MDAFFGYYERPSFPDRHPSMENDTKKAFRTLGFLSTIGLVMAISISLGAIIGYYLDKRLHSGPWLFFIFLGFGIVAAFKNLFTMVKKIQDTDSKSD